MTEGESTWSNFNSIIDDNINFCWEKPPLHCVGLTLWYSSIGKSVKCRGW
jgi:hypothetical protein